MKPVSKSPVESSYEVTAQGVHGRREFSTTSIATLPGQEETHSPLVQKTTAPASDPRIASERRLKGSYAWRIAEGTEAIPRKLLNGNRKYLVIEGSAGAKFGVRTKKQIPRRRSG